MSQEIPKEWREKRKELSMPSSSLQNTPLEKSPLLSREEEHKGWEERPRHCSREFAFHGYCCPSRALLLSPTRSSQGTQSGPIIFNKAGENVFILFTFLRWHLANRISICSGWQCNKLFSSPDPLHEGMAM